MRQWPSLELRRCKRLFQQSGWSLWSAVARLFRAKTADDLIARDRAAKGVAYSLPRGVNPLVLSVFPKSAVFKLRVKQPNMSRIHATTYFMRYRPLPNYSDEISIEVGPKSFIKSIKAELEDRTPQIILKALGGDPSVIKAEEAPDPKDDPEIVLAQDEVDLMNKHDLSQVLVD